MPDPKSSDEEVAPAPASPASSTAQSERLPQSNLSPEEHAVLVIRTIYGDTLSDEVVTEVARKMTKAIPGQAKSKTDYQRAYMRDKRLADKSGLTVKQWREKQSG